MSIELNVLLCASVHPAAYVYVRYNSISMRKSVNYRDKFSGTGLRKFDLPNIIQGAVMLLDLTYLLVVSQERSQSTIL